MPQVFTKCLAIVVTIFETQQRLLRVVRSSIAGKVEISHFLLLNVTH